MLIRRIDPIQEGLREMQEAIALSNQFVLESTCLAYYKRFGSEVLFGFFSLYSPQALLGIFQILVQHDVVLGDVLDAENGDTLLHRAVEMHGESYGLVNYLLHQGCSVNTQNNEGWTPLHVLLNSEKIDQDAVYLLLNAQDIDLTLRDDRGCTFLHLAVVKKLNWLVSLLLERAPSLKNVSVNTDITPLELAGKQLKLDLNGKMTVTLGIFIQLLEAGCILNERVKTDSVPTLVALYCTSKYYFYKCVQLCQDKQPETALFPLVNCSNLPVWKNGQSIVVRSLGTQIRQELRYLGEPEERHWYKCEKNFKPRLFKNYTLMQQYDWLLELSSPPLSFRDTVNAFLNRSPDLSPEIRKRCRAFLASAKQSAQYKSVDKNIALEEALKGFEQHVHEEILREVTPSRFSFAFCRGTIPHLLQLALDQQADSFFVKTMQKALGGKGSWKTSVWFKKLNTENQAKITVFMNKPILLTPGPAAVLSGRGSDVEAILQQGPQIPQIGLKRS